MIDHELRPLLLAVILPNAREMDIGTYVMPTLTNPCSASPTLLPDKRQ